MKKTYTYITIVGLLCAGMMAVLHYGQFLEAGKYAAPTTPSVSAPSASVWAAFEAQLHHPLSILLVQIVAIILTARSLAWVMTKIGQPTVIGEIVAGILLGPSLLGWVSPELSHFLFPATSLGNLQVLSQIGLVLFMFIIGMELDLEALRRTAKDAVVISHASIVFPYFLGIVLAYFMYQTYAPNDIHFLAFALFMGIAMSITAFPVLARIVQERNLTKTAVGVMVIACAAADDVTAWCILAVVIALAKAASLSSAFLTIGFSVGYVVVMMYVVKPILARIAYRNSARETLNKPVIATLFSVLLLSAYVSEIIGIHALFGAFFAGVIMPSNIEFRHVLANKMEDIALVLFLPLFFVLTGLRTQIGLLNDVSLWAMCGVIILVAVTGKFVGSSIAARLVGQSWKDALTIGALMNTRGLMELVVLNIGYDLGILSPAVFAMMVLMALVTTFMTGPALSFIQYFYDKKAIQQAEALPKLTEVKKQLLISFGQPKAGSRLLQLADSLGFTHETDVAALHLTPSADISMTEAEIFEKEGFEPILSTANERALPIQTHYKATNTLKNDIIQFANAAPFQMMLVGSSRPLLTNDETGGKVQEFFDGIHCPIGVLIDRGFTHIQRVMLVIDSPEDVFLADYLNHFSQNKNNHLAVVVTDNAAPARAVLKGLPIRPEKSLNAAILRGYDLLIVSKQYWEEVKIQRFAWLANSPTIFIINK